MTSKFPEPADHQSDLAESDPNGFGSAGPGDPADRMAALRSAISEIDQRHAEGESGFDPFDDNGAGEYDAEFDEAYSKAKKTAMNMLAMRDHSSAELRKKLLGREYAAEVIDELIAKLQKSRLINDEEFAERYVRAHRERRKLSRTALKRELSNKGISADIVAEVVSDVDGEEELARQVAEKKAASSRGLDYEVRERRMLGMLARRGFASAVCLKVTREVLADDNR